MDEHIPSSWRLRQYYYNVEETPELYPVFLKPEWGQNSNGIVCVHNDVEYREFRRVVEKNDMPFIVQHAAPGKKEFELYYIRSSVNEDDYSFLSITQVVNSSRERLPINSIHNPSTYYIDKTLSFSAVELQAIWRFLRQIGNFRMARVGIKTEDRNGLLKGRFHVVEVNIFLPMPLVLLAENVDFAKKHSIVKITMALVSKLVKVIPKKEVGQWIFFRKMKAHYKTAS